MGPRLAAHAVSGGNREKRGKIAHQPTSDGHRGQKEQRIDKGRRVDEGELPQPRAGQARARAGEGIQRNPKNGTS